MARVSMSRPLAAALVGSVVLALSSAASAQSPSASPASPPVSASLVGEWVATYDCEAIVAMLSEAGLDELILEQIWGNGLLPGADSDADIPDPSQPCAGTVTRLHAHFFTADGRFGSRDHNGQQVDDGTYVLLPDDVIEINTAPFRYSIVGDSLTLEPDLPDLSACADMQCRFPAAWMLMVGLPGSTWTRSIALPSSPPSASPA